MATSLDLSTFEHESVTIEVRFAEALSLWDKAGATWQKISEKVSGLSLQNADPRTQVFWVDDRFEMAIELKRAVVVEHRPKGSLEKFSELATHLIDALQNQLSVTEFSRVGCRATYWKPMSSLHAASEAMIDGGVPACPGHAVLGKDANLGELEYRAQYEAKNFGLLLAVRSQSRKLTYNAPINFSHLVKIDAEETFGIQQDFDYYTRGITPSTELRPRIWIDQALHIGKRAGRELTGQRK